MITQIIILVASCVFASAQNSTADIFNLDPDYTYAASVMGSDKSATTYDLAVTYPNGLSTASAILTQGPSTYRYGTSVSSGATQGLVDYNCKLAGSTYADCDITISGSVQGVSTSIITTTTLSGGDVNFVQVPITAGLEKLSTTSTATSTATATPTSAASSIKSMSIDNVYLLFLSTLFAFIGLLV